VGAGINGNRMGAGLTPSARSKQILKKDPNY